MAIDFRPINKIDFQPQGTISDVIQENNIQKDKQKSLMEKLGERAGNIVDIVRKPQDMASILTGEKNIQAAGQIAGGINDVIGAGLGWAGGKIAEATPKAVKEPIKNAGVAILQSPIGQEGLKAIQGGMESYNSWKQSNPRISQDLEAVLNIATLLPISKAGQAVKKTVLETNVAKNYIKQQAEKTAVKTAKEFDNLAGTITQGKIKDIPIAQKALSNIDIEGIKTYKDAVNAVGNKISSIATKLDDALLTDKTLRSIETLKYKNHNFVNDAIKQLDDFYTKVNDIDKKTVINNIATKAKTEGLTVKEINDIARLHGQDLNAFNASGELASGLTKQAAENTRTGVKNTAKTLFNNPVFDAADKEMSNLKKVKDLFNKQVEAVNKLQQKIMERSLGEKAGRMAAKVFNTLGGNAPKGAVEFFLGRGTGMKTINALEMEKMLQKNLQKLQKIANDKLSDKQLIKELEKIVNDLPSTPPILPPTIKSKTSPLNLNKEIKATSNLPQNTSNVNKLSTTSGTGTPFTTSMSKTSTRTLNDVTADLNTNLNAIQKTGKYLTDLTKKDGITPKSNITKYEKSLVLKQNALREEFLAAKRIQSQISGNQAIKSQLSENALIQEAKGKTLEEFVNKNPNIIYRTEKTDIAYKGKAQFGLGKYFTLTAKEAGELQLSPHRTIRQEWTPKMGGVDMYILPKGVKIKEINIDNLSNKELNDLYSKIDIKGGFEKEITKQGYDGVKIITDDSNLGGNQIVLFNTKIIEKTKKTTRFELADIWKKANKK